MSNLLKDRIDYAKKGYEFYVHKYMELFCEKHELEYDKDYWIGFGEIIELADMFINFSDVRLDVDKDVTRGIFTEWYWTTLESNLPHVNYNSWLMGLGYKIK